MVGFGSSCREIVIGTGVYARLPAQPVFGPAFTPGFSPPHAIALSARFSGLLPGHLCLSSS
jgi:hypothetical protein